MAIKNVLKEIFHLIRCRNILCYDCMCKQQHSPISQFCPIQPGEQLQQPSNRSHKPPFLHRQTWEQLCPNVKGGHVELHDSPVHPGPQEQVPSTVSHSAPLAQEHVWLQLTPNRPGAHSASNIHPCQLVRLRWLKELDRTSVTAEASVSSIACALPWHRVARTEPTVTHLLAAIACNERRVSDQS